MKLQKKFVDILSDKKNLLACSGGVDSTALFYILNAYKIPFDTICMSYQIRQEANIEADYVKQISEQFDKKCFIKKAYTKENNFEHQARLERYDFFKQTIQENRYDNLILAHQLDDRFEWLIMQLCKGSGSSELVGFKEIEKREFFTLVRPLYETTKASLRAFLDKNQYHYFLDSYNIDEKHIRNYFRKNWTAKMLLEYESGIRKSLQFLHEDAKILNGEFCLNEEDLFIYKLQSNTINSRLIDKAAKKLGIVLSEKSRLEALKQDVILSRKIAVGKNENFGFIAPYEKVVMDKDFKETCRKLRIPKHIRGYIFKRQYLLKNIKGLS